jgi:hypothetical protein
MSYQQELNILKIYYNTLFQDIILIGAMTFPPRGFGILVQIVGNRKAWRWGGDLVSLRFLLRMNRRLKWVLSELDFILSLKNIEIV